MYFQPKRQGDERRMSASGSYEVLFVHRKQTSNSQHFGVKTQNVANWVKCREIQFSHLRQEEGEFVFSKGTAEI